MASGTGLTASSELLGNGLLVRLGEPFRLDEFHLLPLLWDSMDDEDRRRRRQQRFAAARSLNVRPAAPLEYEELTEE